MKFFCRQNLGKPRRELQLKKWRSKIWNFRCRRNCLNRFLFWMLLCYISIVSVSLMVSVCLSVWWCLSVYFCVCAQALCMSVFAVFILTLWFRSTKLLYIKPGQDWVGQPSSSCYTISVCNQLARGSSIKDVCKNIAKIDSPSPLVRFCPHQDIPPPPLQTSA